MEKIQVVNDRGKTNTHQYKISEVYFLRAGLGVAVASGFTHSGSLVIIF